MTALLPEGFRDRLPPFADSAAALEARVLEAARLHGYERVDPPLAEFADGLEMRLKAGGLHDAVRFVDPVSQRTLAIRPDITAQVARIAATRMGHHPRPVRLSYAGSVLKLRASQLAPARETRQIGCELIGRDSVAADRARIREDIREIKACLLVMGAPLEGDIPPELSCAVISGCRGPVTLDVGGQTVIAGLDPGRPGDVIEIWRALKGLAGGQDVAS